MWTILFTTILTGLVNSKDIYLCYGPVGTPCTSTTISCEHDEIIKLEDRFKITKYHSKSDRSTSYCQEDQPRCPKYFDTDVDIPASLKERRDIFSQCSNRQDYNITVPYNESDIRSNYLYIPYHCKSNKNNVNILEINYGVFSEEVSMYLPSVNHSPINRKYTIKSSLPLTTEALFIALDRDTCSRVVISSNNERLWNCSDDGLLIFNKKLKMRRLHIEILINNLILKEGEYLWLQLTSDANITINSSSLEENKKAYGILIPISLILAVLLIITILLISFTWRRRRRKTLTKQILPDEYCLEKKVSDVIEREMNDQATDVLYSVPHKQRPRPPPSPKTDFVYSLPNKERPRPPPTYESVAVYHTLEPELL